MKKVLFTFFAAFVAFAASAQISQGTILLGGSSNLGFTSNNEDAGDDSQFDLSVQGGYFVIENLAIGATIGYSKWSEADDATITIGPMARYYFNGKIFAGAGFAVQKTGDFSGSVIPLQVGYAAFLNDAVAIEPSLNYSVYGGDYEGSSFGLNVGISVYLNRGE